MSKPASRVSGRSQKLAATSSALAAVLAVANPAFLSRANATNAYDWVKPTDHDLMGGTYTAVASSADGSHLIVGTADGGEGYSMASPLYVSADYGTTWENVTDNTEAGIRNHWQAVDVTNDGETMVAASGSSTVIENLSSAGGKIFISNDSGNTWQDISPVGYDEWYNVAISGDDSKIVALASDDTSSVYTSSDGGDSWQTSAVDDVWYWESVSISDDGNTILVGGENNSTTSIVDISVDGGDTWADVSPDGGDMVFVTNTAMSSAGDKIAVTTNAWNGDVSYEAVYVSDDNGATWDNVTPDDEAFSDWVAVAISDDGAVLSLLDYNDKMFVSTDNGATWTEEFPGAAYEDGNNWQALDLNETGSRAIVASPGNTYVGHNSLLDPTPPAPEVPAAVELVDAEGGKAITLTTPSGTTITCHSSVKETGLSAQDGAYSYPLGLVDFCFSGADASNEITLVFVTDLKPNQVAVRKYNPTSKEYATISAANVVETTVGGKHALRVTYTVTDNGPLDTDPDAGEVADPVGLAVLAATTPNTGIGRDGSELSVVVRQAVLPIAAAVTMLYAPVRRKLYSRVSTKK